MLTLLFTGVCCIDCALIIANDDDSGIERPDLHRQNMADTLHANGWDSATLAVGDAEATQEFSKRDCDTCGSTLAGARLEVVVLERKVDVVGPQRIAVGYQMFGDLPAEEWFNHVLVGAKVDGLVIDGAYRDHVSSWTGVDYVLFVLDAHCPVEIPPRVDNPNERMRLGVQHRDRIQHWAEQVAERFVGESDVNVLFVGQVPS